MGLDFAADTCFDVLPFANYYPEDLDSFQENEIEVLLELDSELNLGKRKRVTMNYPKTIPSELCMKKAKHLLEEQSKVYFLPRTKIVAEEEESVTQAIVDEPKKGGKAKRGKHWDQMEEIILIGVIFEQLFCTGCLNQASWDVILKDYNRCWTEHCKTTGKKLTGNTRTKCALQRHFKVMKSKLPKELHRGAFKKYYNMWNEKFGSK
mmetsp:Transcript_9916/g.11343  ORF Transcript_9916/g.11343 Transcript_9916/m.11343 type:complete len:207 (+) Transcript_9916:168-788(+)|eukprot:CAMPEP_0184019516 /NCGR_PEP_ID=MMETSP0954-20121128/8796_1 /TAXON_ID=627963 /ORGANISM="Aplanochytrium sp, Strain PBS07" /LENGTH=206 /DNA_ID=CAMNT_0026301193 /DNA_START=123 /DNA_END=743 /DNA_ORIENTATION=-